MSHREKKHMIQRGVAALRARPGWDPSQRATDAPIEAAIQADRTEQVYGSAVSCDGCARERGATGDATALCDEHLALAAMGR